jgi:NADP-dependent 3-hydroxy acid dehydrogenase YdfG
MSDKKIWFITGCSSGFGRCLVEELLKTDHSVIATARDTKTLSELVEKYPKKILALKLDVTDPKNIKEALATSLEKFGRIDVLVNNAGYGMIGALEESDDAEIKRIFDTNVFGLMNVTKTLLPFMRKQKSGHIINISSVAGFTATPGFGIYNATKFAVEGLSEALAGEVGVFGIKVTIIEPGPFRTDFANRSLSRAKEMPEYDESMKNTRQYIKDADGNQAGDPVRGAKAMMALVEMQNPPVRIPFGKIAMDRIKVKINNFQNDMEKHQKMILETDFPK